MAREFPIHNGRMTTDLDANGHKIKNLPPGSGFTQAQSDWSQTDTTAPDFIKNKPSIPEPVTIDSALSTTSENPVQNKVVAKALYTGFTEWRLTTDNLPQGYSFVGAFFVGDSWRADIAYDDGVGHVVVRGVNVGGTQDSTSITFTYVNTTNTMSRHLITPTKTSQLTNDSDFASAWAVLGKLDGDAAYPMWVSGSYATGDTCSFSGRLYRLTGPLVDQSVAPPDAPWWTEITIQSLLAQKASIADLPYALVTPGEWEFSEGNYEIFGPNQDGDVWKYTAGIAESQAFSTEAEALSALVLYFVHEPSGTSFTATRASLPGHLLDRAGNRVVVSGDTTLTLPALTEQGKLRDFLVRLEISGSTMPTITFAAPTGETITYETDGDEFPVPDEAGTWSYSFTENCVAHVFAVSLKKVSVVTQGGV